MSTKPQRFNPVHYFDQGGKTYGCTEADDEGDYVAWGDYVILEREINDANAKISELEKHVEDLKQPPNLRPIRPGMKRTPLARMSKRRKREREEYMKLRKQFLSDHNLCQLWMELNCLDENDFAHRIHAVAHRCPIATEIHHRCCGGNRKATYLRTDTWMALSPWGHRFIHDNPKLAYERGWLLKQIPPTTN